MSCGVSPAVASPSTKTAPSFRHTETDHARKDVSKGPLQIIISVDQQKLHLYSDGVHVADAPVATGVPGSPNAARHFQHHPEKPRSPLQYLQQRADAVHGTHHLVGRRAARRFQSGPPGFAWLHPHVARIRHAIVGVDQARRGRRHCPPGAAAGGNFRSASVRAQGKAGRCGAGDIARSGCAHTNRADSGQASQDRTDCGI